MPNAAIEFEFKGNLASLRRDLNEAARLAKASANETSRATRETFNESISSAFRRTPERRAERAFAALGTGLLTGDIGLAIGSFTEKITAFGLAAGTGVGIAIGVFEKFRHEIHETNQTFDALRQDLSRPFALESRLGPEALTSLIEAGDKKLEAAVAKRESGWNKFAEFLNRGTIPAGSSDVRFGGAAPVRTLTRGEELERLITEELERQAKRTAERADKELKIANLKLMAVTTSEKEADLAKITLDAEEKRAALLLNRPGGNTLDLFKSKLAIDVEEQAARLQVAKKFPLPPPAPVTPRSPVDVSGHTLSEILKSGLMPGADGKWYWPEQNDVASPPPQALKLPTGPPGWDYNAGTGEWIMERMGFKRTIGPSSSGTGALDNVGTGIDGLKQGIDLLNQKMDRYWS